MIQSNQLHIAASKFLYFPLQFFDFNCFFKFLNFFLNFFVLQPRLSDVDMLKPCGKVALSPRLLGCLSKVASSQPPLKDVVHINSHGPYSYMHEDVPLTKLNFSANSK